jgi:small-conductance mechanosensitive channel
MKERQGFDFSSPPGNCTFELDLVQDITLFSTTLRFGASNEVSTVSNGSIASARITNCARSKNATVHLFLKLHINLHKDKNLDLFREALENFVLDYPNVWDSIVFLRCEEIDKDNEFVMYRLAIRSRQSWQVCTRVLQERARLHQFCIELATKLEVSFDSAPARRVLYYGGNLVDGHVKEYKKDLTADQNIQSSGDLGPLLRQAEEAIATEEQGMDTPNPSVVEQVSGENVAVAQSGMTETQGNADMLFLSMVQQSHG